ncbi:uncharacterized protein BKA78DRAFT_294399 [Phyllosticta capitalensis]|uniref:uncharacterized protein n=1 Tax=Phyllosticta capitalensis TaxID=121624 RepID=UPI0031302CD9
MGSKQRSDALFLDRQTDKHTGSRCAARLRQWTQLSWRPVDIHTETCNIQVAALPSSLAMNSHAQLLSARSITVSIHRRAYPAGTPTYTPSSVRKIQSGRHVFGTSVRAARSLPAHAYVRARVRPGHFVATLCVRQIDLRVETPQASPPPVLYIMYCFALMCRSHSRIARTDTDGTQDGGWTVRPGPFFRVLPAAAAAAAAAAAVARREGKGRKGRVHAAGRQPVCRR